MGIRTAGTLRPRRPLHRRGIALLALAVAPLVLSSCYGSISGGKTPTNGAPSAGNPGTLIAELFTAGETELNKHDFHGAIEDFSTVIVLPGVTKGDIALANYDVAVAYVAQESAGATAVEASADIQAAIAALKKALAANPNYTYALNDLAILEKPLDPQFAITLYKRLLKTNPPNLALTYTSLGNLLIQTGQTAEGEKDLGLAASLGASGTPVGPSGGTPT